MVSKAYFHVVADGLSQVGNCCIFSITVSSILSSVSLFVSSSLLNTCVLTAIVSPKRLHVLLMFRRSSASLTILRNSTTLSA